MKNLLPVAIFFSIWTWSCSCSNSQRPASAKSEDKGSLTVPDEYFSKLFMRDCCGFTGGDGTYSVLLPDGRTVWIFGDTFLGTVNADLSRERVSPMYIRNCFVVQDGDSLTTLHSMRGKLEASLVVPPSIADQKKYAEDSIWFWPGDALVENEVLKLFLSAFSQADTGMWGFRWESTWLATFSLPDIRQISLEKIHYGEIQEVHYGHALLEEQDYTYVYGAHQAKPHVARYPAGDHHGTWEFYTGSEWTDDPLLTGPMDDIQASEQFSVLKINNRYVYISQMGSLGKDICSLTSDTPYGPGKNKSLLYTTPLPEENKNLFTYNALAHPQFIKNEHILVSYNTNSFVLKDHFMNADIYRPRFVWVPLKLIDPEF